MPLCLGGQYSTTIQPRRALKEFIPRCLERGLLLGLSTWFFGPGVDRVVGADGFVRVWDQTLEFLKENDLLHNIWELDQGGGNDLRGLGPEARVSVQLRLELHPPAIPAPVERRRLAQGGHREDSKPVRCENTNP